MTRNPISREVLASPVTVGVALFSTTLTIAWWTGRDVSALFADPRVRHGEPWRLLTACLLHGDILHLAFNLYWLWQFGAAIEGRLGHGRTAALYALLAAGSSAAQFALSGGGVGLSGIGYGLFGFLYVAKRRDPRFLWTMDRGTVELFVGWFFLCVLLTWMGFWHVGNVAHGSGAVLGASLGGTVGAGMGFPTPRRALYAVLFTVEIVACLAMATLGYRFVHHASTRGQDEARLGWQALQGGRDEEALRWFMESTDLAPTDASGWFHLGIALHRLGRLPEAREAYRRAAELDPTSAEYGEALRGLEPGGK